MGSVFVGFGNRCAQCRAEIYDGDKFCLRCGMSTKKEVLKCGGCGHPEARMDAEWCTRCGTDFG